ncbi:hypothetical protein BVRB_2g039090 [Beta vulgaris subsp. vulgaris]|nr:hypothetical protein BVRB_2g039090 [Beta vulgaris subsp. vulgaris]
MDQFNLPLWITGMMKDVTLSLISSIFCMLTFHTTSFFRI